MKTLALFRASLFSLALLGLASCNRDKEAAQPNPAAANEDYKVYTQVFQGFSGVSDNINQAYADTASDKTSGRLSSGCASFAINFNSQGNPVPGFGTNYGRIVLDYTGRDCGDGISRSGKITVYFAGWLTTWKDSVVLDNFTTNGLRINGYRTSRYNTTLSNSATSAYDVRVAGEVVGADGQALRWSSQEVHKLVNFFTPTATVEVVGSGSVDNKKGYVINGVVTAPLLYKGSCSPAFRYPVQGTLELTNNLAPSSKTSVNYGSGTCDNAASFLDAFGQTYNFLIP